MIARRALVLLVFLAGCPPRGAPRTGAPAPPPSDTVVLVARNPGLAEPMQVDRLAVSADATRVFATGIVAGFPRGEPQPGVRVWERSSGRLVAHVGDEVVRGFDVAPSGAWLVTAGADGHLRVWDVERGALRWSAVVGGADLAGAWLLADDGSRVLTLERTGRVATWREGVPTPERATTMAHPATVATLGRDRRSLVMGNADGAVQLLDVASFDGVQVGVERFAVTALAFVPGSRTVLTGHADGNMYFWETDAFQRQRAGPGHRYPVRALAMFEDGTVCAADEWLWCLRGDELVFMASRVQTFAPSADGALLVAGMEDGSIQTFDRARGVPAGSATAIDRVGFAAAGALIACGARFGQLAAGGAAPPPCRRWDLPTNAAAIVDDRHAGPLAVSVSGRLIAVAGDRTHEVWNVALDPPRQVLSLPAEGPVSRAAFSHDERWLVLVGRDDGKIDVVDVRDGTRTARYVGPPLPALRIDHGWPSPPWIERVAIASDGELIALGDPREIILWHLPTDTSQLINRGPIHVALLAFTPDDTRLVVATQASGLEVWDAVAPNLLHALLRADRPPLLETVDDVTTGTISDDGTTLVTGHLRSLRIWNLATGAGTVLLDDRVRITATAISPDGTHIAWADRLGGLYLRTAPR